jgi:hypothetical protein
VSAGRCPYCPKAVLWVKTRRGKNMPLDARPDRHGVFVPLKGRAWEPRELAGMGEPWADFADAPRHHNHITTCPLWPRDDPGKARGSARGHLACMACGTVDATVRHCPEGDRCRDCRPSTGDSAHGTPPNVTPAATS